jgi:hypothetical protein
VEWTQASALHLYTDACTTGYGAMFGTQWFAGRWTPEEEQQALRSSRDSMPWKELYVLVLAASTWGQHWQGKKIIFFTDQQGNVASIYSGSSKQPQTMQLLRTLAFLAAQHRFDYKAQHVAGVLNVAADLLSRDQVPEFKERFPAADAHPVSIIPLPQHSW